ncbi:MAG: ABC transporter permease [Polyangiaceae bacterium]
MLFEGLDEILSVLRRNKLRTTLTALSVAWGMFMLAVLLGAGKGLENGVNWEFRDDATNSISISSGKTSVPFAGRGPGRAIRFDNDDYDMLARSVPLVEQQSGRFYLWGEFFVSYGKKHAAFDIRGIHPGHRFFEKTEMLRGRFLNDADIAQKRKVALIGKRVTESLFGDENPLGKIIQIRGLSYQVVGEYEDIGGEAELRRIYVPISTAQLIYNQPRNIHQLLFTMSTNDVEESKRIADIAHGLLAAKHGVSLDDRRGIRVQNNLEQFVKMTRVFKWINVFVWIVGMGTLLAGIVGVSNIMLISVAERTKELGIRKALGATPFSIVSMVVVESSLVTAAAGYSGLVAGVAVIEFVAQKAGSAAFFRDPSVDLRVALIATGVLVVAGALAGFFPALRAARVDPIVALRQGD